MSKSSLKVLIVAMTAVCATHIVHAQFQPEFEFTEDSSSALAVTYGGNPLTVNQTGPDMWTFSLPLGFFSSSIQQWTEPDNANSVNTVDFVNGGGFVGFVASDFARNTVLPEAADDGRVQVGLNEDLQPIFATFHDNAATAEATVPDTGTTCSLLGFSLIAFAFLRRKLC